MANLYLKALGLINLSYFGDFLVKPRSYNVAIVILRFHSLFFLLPDLNTLNTYESLKGSTFVIGTSQTAALVFFFSLILLLNILALFSVYLSSKKAGLAT